MPSAFEEQHFLFLLCGSRRGGNSEQLARHAAAQLPADATQQWLDLTEYALPPFRDLRHEGADPWRPEPAGDERALLDATVAATDLVMVAPVYWYGLPAPGKLYLDHWSAWLRAPHLDFKARMAGRVLWAVSALSADDKSQAAPVEGTLKLTADYMDMRWGGHLVGTGNQPGEVFADRAAVEQAKCFFHPHRHSCAAGRAAA